MSRTEVVPPSPSPGFLHPMAGGMREPPGSSSRGLTHPGDSLNLSERVAHWQPPGLGWPLWLPASSGDALLPAKAGPWVCRATVLERELQPTQGDSRVRGSRCPFPWDHWGCGGSSPLCPPLWLSPCEAGAPRSWQHLEGWVWGGQKGWCPLTVRSSACQDRCPHTPTTVSPEPF